MPIRQMSGLQTFPLSTGATDNPTYTPGSPIRFYLSTLPRAAGNLAYYLYGIYLTFNGTLTQSGGTGAVVFDQRLYNILIDYLSVQGAWCGSPMSSQNVKGYWLPTILAVGTGYNLAMPPTPSLPTTNGASGLSKTIFIPFGLGNGDKPHQTAQLNVLYKNAFFEVGCQAAAVLAAISPGATFTGTIRASAACFPESEIRVGPGVEWVDYQTVAAAGQTQVLISGFGNSTQMTNSEQGAGVAFAMAMSNLQGQPGAFDPQNLTQVTVPFRNQLQTNHVQPFLSAALASMGERRPMGTGAFYVAPGTYGQGAQLDISDWPYTQVAVNPGATVGINTEMVGLQGLPLVPQATGFQLSKMQVVSGDVSYYMAMSSGPTGMHHTLVQHVRSWAPQSWADALKAISDSGLIGDVFGSNSGELAWSVKMVGGKNPASVRPGKLRFLPMALKPKAHVQRRQARG